MHFLQEGLGNTHVIVEGIACYYGNCLRFKKFELHEGSLLYGPNGSGKSTLLTLLNPFIFDLKDEKSLRRALVTYTSLKWPLPEFLRVTVDSKELIMVRAHPFKKYEENKLKRALKELLKKYGANEVGDALDFEVKNVIRAEGYTFQTNAFVYVEEKASLISGGEVKTNFVLEGSAAPAYLTPHAPLVRNVLMGSLKEGNYSGPCLDGLPRVVEVVEEPGEVSPVKVVYDTGEKNITVEPWVLGDGEKALLLYCALKNSKPIVLDSPEAFLFQDALDALVKDVVKSKVIVATSSKSLLDAVKGFRVYEVKRRGNEVEVKARGPN